MGSVPLVSVVIPNFNSERYIRQTIASVQAQTFSDWEIVVVDDCSTDSSPAIVQAIAGTDSRISLIQQERNAGRPAIPRNVGVQVARGAYIALLDADDIWHPQKLETQVSFMRAQGARFTSTRINCFREDAEVVPARLPQGPRVTCIRHDRLLRKNIIPTSSVIVERELLTAYPFIEDTRYKAIEDYHCWLTLHQHAIECSYKFEFPFVNYRLAVSSISKSKMSMFRKNHMLYSEYQVGGKPLGLRKYWYLGSYVLLSLTDRLSQRVVS